MKSLSLTARLLVLLLLAVRPADALPILDVSGALTLADPTQLGRLSRNAIPQDWVGSEPFPGIINTTTQYHYHVYQVNVGSAPFIQVNFDSVLANTFIAAYDTSYVPNSAAGPNLGFDTNWLGDAGFSGNVLGVDPIFFQVIVPQNHNLLLVINNTAAADVGVGDPFRLIVEGFIDSSFTDPAPPVPEPATVLLSGSGLVWLVLRSRRRWRLRRRAKAESPEISRARQIGGRPIEDARGSHTRWGDDRAWTIWNDRLAIVTS